MSRHFANFPSYLVTGSDQPRLKIRVYEKVLPIVDYRTDERRATDDNSKQWRNCDYQEKTEDPRRGKCSRVSSSIMNPVAYPGIFRGGVQQNQLRTAGKETGGSGGDSPLVRGSTQLVKE
jgi:hypothetical protein